ncbi:nucleotidyltransferase [Geomonas sp. Red276]
MNDGKKRWHRTFMEFTDALSRLEDAIKLREERELTPVELQGLIKTFEFTHQLAWNAMMEFFEYEGTELVGFRDVTREAFERGLISAGDKWLEMIRSRRKAGNSYLKVVADELCETVVTVYAPLFSEFRTTMQEQMSGN